MALRLGDGVLRILGDTSDAEKKVGGLKGRLSGMFGNAGRMAMMGLTTSVMAAGGAAVFGAKKFMDFDAAMTESTAIMGDVSTEMRAKLEQTARDVAKTTTFSADQAAEAYFYLASAGMDAEQSIAALPQVARFAQAGNFDLALATDLLTDAQSALGQTADDANTNLENQTRLSDILVGANTLANATVQQFSESLTNKAGNAMKELNIDTADGVAVLAAWADQGVKGAEAGERFNIVTRDLQRAARDNREEFEKYGIAVFDSEGNFRNMADIISDMENALGDMSAEQKGATLAALGFTDRSIAATRSLLGSSDAIREYSDELNGLGGITDEVADKQLESFKNKVIILWSKITDLAMVLGGPLIGGLEKVVDWLSSVLDGFGNVEEKTGGLTAALSGIAGVFTAPSWAAAMEALGVPKGIVMDLFGHFRTFRRSIDNVSTTIGNMVAGVMPGLQQAFEWIQTFVTTIWQTQIAPALSSVFELFGSTVQWLTANVFPVLQGWLESLVGWVTENWPLISNAFEIVGTIVGSILEHFITALGFALEAVMHVWPSIQVVIETVVGVIAGIIETFLHILAGDWGAAWDSILGIFVTIWEGIVAFIGTIPELILGILKGLLAAVMIWAGALAGKLLGAVGKLVGSFVSRFATLPGKAMGVVAKFIPQMVKWIGTTASRVIGAVTKFIGKFVGFFKKIPGKAMDGVKSLPGKLLGFIREIPGKIASAALNIGTGIMKGIIRGITRMIGAAVDAVTGAVGGIVDGALGFLGIGSPSKVFAKIGEQTMEGLAVGLSDVRNPARALDNSLGALTNRGLTLSGDTVGALRGSGGQSIHIENLHLPDVTDAREFSEALRHLGDSRG